MGIVAIVSLAFVLIGITMFVLAWRSDDRDAAGAIGMTGITLSVVSLLVALVSGYLAIMPDYRLHRAEIEKRILVEQAKAEADAAVEEARAEVERARGTAEANKIVADSITEPYLRYLYINNLKNTDNQVIYLPTEAGLPILEAKRLDK